MDTVRIPHSRGIRLADPFEIIRIEASSNYCRIYFEKGNPLTVAKVLQWFQVHLPTEMFSRVHRSHLVNKMHIVLVKGHANNTLVLSNGDNVVMSRRKKNGLQAAIPQN